MKTLVKNRDTGKIEASPGNNDDRVMSLGIAVTVALELRDSGTYASGEDVGYMDRFRQGGDGTCVTLSRGGY